MKPQFADTASWQQADMLMQPALIRTIDNVRKQLEQETTTWKGEYREFPIWPADVSEETQAKIVLLQQELNTATPAQVDDIEDALAQMPQPIPGYELVLSHPQQPDPIIVNVWEICYRICFLNPDAVIAGEAPVQVDTSLIEDDTQAVNWTTLDTKTKLIIDAIFEDLNGVNSAPGDQ
ncbi:hypothetical protein IQ266_05445 [filamentous cyanobacterium LEGE 11480]|uniref:Uncharacterized protein n=1 Tax=Romeriopsis navalis LEGE 11480 TaxID=2777977 RepID=A0A928Z1D1_9CYAN|nr:hypothetical protein [Romeriopsis navalis LEGE 11480]